MIESVWEWIITHPFITGITISIGGIGGLLKAIILKPKVDVKFESEPTAVVSLIGQLFNPTVSIGRFDFPRTTVEDLRIKVGITGTGLKINPEYPPGGDGKRILKLRLTSSRHAEIFYIAQVKDQNNQKVAIDALKENILPPGNYEVDVHTDHANSPPGERWKRSFRVLQSPPYLQWFGDIDHSFNTK